MPLIFLLGCIALYFSERKQLALQHKTNLVLSTSRDSRAVPWAAPPPRPPCAGAPPVLRIEPSHGQSPPGTRGEAAGARCRLGNKMAWS